MSEPISCPDCKGEEWLELITKGCRRIDYPNGFDYEEEEFDLEEPYYKCQCCKKEFDQDAVEEWEGLLEMEKREDRIRAYEEKGCTRSDAQAVVDAEDADLSPNGYSSKTIEAEENEGRVV